MVSYKLRVNDVLYSELDEMYRYVQRASIPSYLGRAYGTIYTRLMNLPDSKEYMNYELDEISEFYTEEMKKVKRHFQQTAYNLLVNKPDSCTDIYFPSYISSLTDIYSQIQFDVDYHDGRHEIINVDDSNIDEYFKVTHVFKQDKTKGYSESEADTYSFLENDYYVLRNPFPGVEKYDINGVTGSCRNFTFQVTEDCNLRCFAEGTKVLMANYTQKNIEDVVVGDVVMGFNEHNDGNIELIPARVTHTFKRSARTIKLTTPTGETYVTPNHEYITGNGEWVDAKSLDNSKHKIVMAELVQEEKDIRFDVWKSDDFSIDKKQLFMDPITVYNIETTTATYVANNVCCHNCSYCFPAGTKILLSNGSTINIEDITPGMEIIGFDENEKFNFMNQLYPTTVTDNISRMSTVVEIHFIDKKINPIVVTPEHPFYTANRGWVNASDLRLNDRLIKYDGSIDTPIYSCPAVDHVKFTDTTMQVFNLTTTAHTYVANSYLVHNCYQTNKCASIMDLETAKSAVDDLLAGNFEYLSPGFSKSIILEFIGGDPLLEIDLIGEIYEYFLQEAYRLNHPWFHHHRMSMCSNGMLYFNYATKRFFDKYAKQTSFNISIDGNKALHDACRIQPTGEGSYDIGIAGVHHSNSVYRIEISSKMTLAPSNIPMIMDSIKSLCIDNNYPGVNLNVVFEDVWNQHDARVLYDQLVGVADMVFEHDRPDLYFSIFRSSPLLQDRDISDDLQNVCFRAGTQVLTVDGNKNIEDIKVGDFVYSASGTIQRVVDVSSHWSIDNVRVKATGAYPIECTRNHKFFAMPFDYMGWKGVKHWKKKDFYPIGDLKAVDKKNGIKVGDKIALPIIDFSKITNHIDPKLAYVLGVFVADGFVNGGDSDIVLITPGYDADGYYLNKLRDAGLNFTVETTKSETSVCYRINGKNGPINRTFVDICKECGHLAHNKHVPEIIFKSDVSTVSNFILGYFDTDGYLDANPKSKTCGYRKANTVSHHLANDMTFLLRSLGYFPTVYLNERQGTMKIEGRTVNVKNRYELYFREDGSMPLSFMKDDEYPVIWSSIQSVEPIDPFLVYNITVEGPGTAVDPSGEHTYIANGVAVSNCGGAGSMLSLDPHGTYYPCIRYMPSSLNGEAVPLVLGDVNNKMLTDTKLLREFTMVTQLSQQNDRCLSCPLVRMCSWCFAEDTTVLMGDYTLKYIQDVVEGDTVISSDGKPHRVERVLRRKTDDTMSVKAYGTPRLFTTKSHKFYGRKRPELNGVETMEEIAAVDLTTDHQLKLFNFGDRDRVKFDDDAAYIVGRWVGSMIYDSDVSTFNFLKEKKADALRVICNCIVSGEVTIASEIYSWDDVAIKSFLSGVYDCAGYSDDEETVYIMPTRKLAVGIAMLERCVGYKSDVQHSMLHGDVDAYVCKRPTTGVFDIEWADVTDTNDQREYTVYNLTVEGTHDYVADGVLVRNCSGLCYQLNGTVNERTTTICEMIKAEYLASIYYWGNMARKYPQFEIILDEEMVPYYHFEKIISRNEYDELNALITGNKK